MYMASYRIHHTVHGNLLFDKAALLKWNALARGMLHLTGFARLVEAPSRKQRPTLCCSATLSALIAKVAHGIGCILTIALVVRSQYNPPYEWHWLKKWLLSM